MKKTLTLSENEFIGVIKRIAEQVNLNDYSQEDFFDVFFQVFRSWIGEKLGDEYKKYPMSLLLKKYGQEFAEDKGLVHRGHRDQFDSSYYSLEHYGKELVKKSFYTLPQLYQQQSFTEKYKKVIPHFVEMLELPSFINLTFEEREPNRVTVKFNTNFEEWMKYPERKSIDEYNTLTKLKKIFTDFGGVDFGNPAHGEVQMDYSSSKDFSTDEWVKKELNKVIKKAIRGLGGSENLHSIRFKPSNRGGRIELVFKDRYRFGYKEKRDFVSQAQEVVSNLGYGPNLSVDNV
jgi:hypothetical protein